jgi:hypothetical protein
LKSSIYNHGLRLLGFIFRACADFKDPYTLLNLFNPLIRSRLEYCSSVWSPHYIKYKKIVEKLQRKLVKFMFHKKLIVTTSDEFNYLDCCKILKIDTLEKRRIRQDLKFLVRSLKNEIDTQTSTIWIFLYHKDLHGTSQILYCTRSEQKQESSQFSTDWCRYTTPTVKDVTCDSTVKQFY